MELWNDWTIELTVDAVLRGQGIDPETARRRTILMEAAEWAMKEGSPLLEPQVLALQVGVKEVRHTRLILEGGARLDGELPSSHLAGAKAVVIMLATLGETLETVAAGTMQTDPALGMALEGVGVAAIEILASRAANRIEDQARLAGWQSSIPLSPGMVGWPTERGQPQVLSLLEPHRIGVRVTSSWLMIPRMSVTQVVGLGPEMLVDGCACDYCSLAGVCQYSQHQ